jgi:hypothetical protein
MKRLGAALLAWFVGGAAFAQEDVAGTTFELNTVLVATFEAVQPFLEPEAERVRGLVESALAAQYVVVTMNDVPAFTDYSAEVYLRSCPEGQYIGCVFVIGGRAKTDWVVGGQVSAVEGGYRVFMSFVDVSLAKLQTEIDVTLEGGDDAQFQAGLLKIMDALTTGQLQQLDVRGDPEAEAAAKAEAEAAERAAKQFTADSVYEDPEDLQRGASGSDAGLGASTPTGRVTNDDLAAMSERGGLPPWEKAGLTRSQYKLYRNSGAKLDEFRDRLLGRKGQMLISLSAQVGTGPWGQVHDSWYLLAADADPGAIRSRDVLDQSAVQKQFRAPFSLGGQFEIGFGMASWAEISLFGGLRQAAYSYRFFREVEGTGGEPGDFVDQSAISLYGGLRVGFIPFPAYPVRPRLHVGGSFWYGSKLQKLVEVPSFLVASQMRPNNMILLHINPGVEVSAGKWILVWTRFDLDVPVMGRNLQVFNIAEGDERLSDRPPTDTDKGFGLGASLGLTARIPIGPKRRGL